MTAVTGKGLIEGEHIWVRGYAIGVGYVPVELVVVDSQIESGSNRLKVAYANLADQRYHAASFDYETNGTYIYLGDQGVRPYNYDSRQPQVFFTRKALEDAIDEWDGRNPNFLYVS